MADLVATDDKLDLILRGIEELRQRAPHQKRGLVFSEYQLLQKLLPALGATFGEAVFTVHDVLENPVFRAMLNGTTSKRLGNLFSRAEGWKIGKHRLSRSGSFDDHVTLWNVLEVVS